MSSVEDGGPDQVPRGGTRWSATVRWRDWPLLVKLGMVLVVPVVSALVLGVLRVRADVVLADSYRDVERTAALRVEFVGVLSAVQLERDEAVRAGGHVAQAADKTDRAVEAMTAVVARNPGLGAATTGYRALVRALNSLPAARRQLGGDGMTVISAYTAIVNTVLEYDRSLVWRFPEENVAGTSVALAELQGLREQVALQQAIGSVAVRDRVLPDSGRQQLVETEVRLTDKLDDFRAQAPAALATRYDDAMTAPDVTRFRQLVDAVRTTDPTALPFGQQEWDTAAAATITLMTGVTRAAADNLRAESADLAEAVSDRAGLESVLLLTMVLLAGGVGGGVGRHLLRSVGVLRRTALDVAHERLPAAVASIRTGQGAPPIEPVPLRSTEEFGQLARAFDAVHGQAVRSAAEEASLRSNLANIFTNLSRRSQGLVERQLRLMEQLERRTEDPDQLESLFRIDHLATRMRRNNENLMVLSGTGALRRFAEPMPLPDVLRAAISEVEHYQRAIVGSVPDVRIAGYAAGDLIRSLSELIENATAFSPPDSRVSVVSRLLRDGSAVVEIADAGVGMAEQDLAEANNRVTGGGGVDVPISRQMGLFVVGRLTARHGIHVRLVPRAEGGLCASVLVPVGLVHIAEPGATAVLELPRSDQPGPPTTLDWLRTPVVPRSSPPVGKPGKGSWLAAANTTAAPGTRSTAISWLQASAKAAPGKRKSAWLDAATAGAPAAADVTRQLESAGIVVRVPDLPAATTPASILFADKGTEEPAIATGPGGLPKRVPMGHLVAPARGQEPPAASGETGS